MAPPCPEPAPPAADRSAVRPVAGLAALVLLAGICWLSLSDHLPPLVRDLVQGRQLAAHGAMHLLLAATAMAAFPGRRWRMAGALVALAVGLEAVQGLTATREAALADVLANLGGSTAGIGLALALGLSGSRPR